jgi:hypothetical protein
MNTDEFIQIWKAYDARLERSLQLNLRLLQDMQTQKARTQLNSLLLPRTITIVLGLLWELLLGVVLYHVWGQVIMAVSVGVFFICTGYAIIDCIKDIVVIKQISLVDSIRETQEKMAALQRSMIRNTRLMWLQLPFWTTFFVSNAMIRDGGIRFWLIQVPVTACFTVLTVFLYRNIIQENMAGKRWVRGFLQGCGALTVARAMHFIKEVEEFKEV